jgi:hypothetical protein
MPVPETWDEMLSLIELINHDHFVTWAACFLWNDGFVRENCYYLTKIRFSNIGFETKETVGMAIVLEAHLCHLVS